MSLTAAIAVGLAVWALADRLRAPASHWTAVTALSAAVMVVCATLAAGVRDTTLREACWTGTWLAMAFLGLAFYNGVTVYAGAVQPRSRGRRALLWAPTLLVVVIALTNPLHRLLWTRGEMASHAPGTVIDVPSTALSVVGYSVPGLYALMAIGIVVKALMTAPRLYRDSFLLLAAGVGVTFILSLPSTWHGEPAYAAVLSMLGPQVSAASLLVCVRRHPIVVQSFGFRQATREAVVELMSEGVIVVDPTGIIVDQNPAAGGLLGLPHSLVGSYAGTALPPWLEALVRDAGATPASVSRTLEDDTTVDLTVTRVGGGRSVDASDVIIVIRDGSARARAEARLEQMAHRDALTGLPNRALLDLEIARRLGGEDQVAFMLLDLNGFKAVNDTYGHHMGDQLLREAARRLKECGIPGAFVARLGGDEFVVMASYRDETHARGLAERVAGIFDSEIGAAGHSLRITASVGLALTPRHAHDILRCADVAMYQAKSGHTRVVLYDADADPNTPERLRHLSDLRGAVMRGELVLHYQPIYDLHAGRATGAEALVRWQHPTRGLLYPGDFLGEIDEAGIGRDLARWVITRCVADRAQWPTGPDGFQVAFNLNVRDLADARLIDDLLRTVAQSDLSPGEIIVEVTEMVFLDSHTDAEEHRSIRRLREAGLQLVLDDFGTGHASVTMLRDLRGTVAKIGGVFVTHMRHDADDLALVKGLTDLATHLDYQVLAEWVEDAETLELCRAVGCRYVQGFHIARPMPHADMMAWLCAQPDVTCADACDEPPCAASVRDTCHRIEARAHEAA